LCFYPYILILKKTIQINNIKSPEMLTLRFFFPSVYIPRVLRINLFKQANQKDELWCLVGYCA
jgi:hypothetical protein